MLSLAPPFVETDGVVLKRDAGLYARAVSRIVDDQVEPHEPPVILRIGAAELADQRVEDLEGVHLQGLFLDDHLMDADRVVVQPRSEPEGLGAFRGIQGELVHRVVDFFRVERVEFFRNVHK